MSQIENNSRVEFNDECPAHGNEVRKEYDFGQRDATIYTFCGCKCAVLIGRDVAGFEYEPIYCTSYNEASGTARMQASMNYAKCR